jgi:hypothetical protein
MTTGFGPHHCQCPPWMGADQCRPPQSTDPEMIEQLLPELGPAAPAFSGRAYAFVVGEQMLNT